ncbi:RNA polymerase I enhancer binding protein [Coemansia aciculifera]|uniref:RNA polymerase I enhancer binding protein n=1 Tax=Coemansia aciculifera TaxID=417176 RepID=A0A9W8IPV8_9FUNG|nr:RNA polymerase I enhancer binding protein [Coemansia aciculifera]
MTPSRNIDSEGEASDEAVMALAELLQLYSGLMGDSVEAAARALMQAKVAASEVQSMRGGAQDALQRVRLSRSVVNATSSRQTVHAQPHTQTQTLPQTQQRHQHHNQGQAQRHGVGRRWFTQEHLMQMQRDGVVFTKGKFTEAENTVIESTIAAFVSAHGLTQQQIYDHLFRHKTRDSTGKQLRKAFWPILAEALPLRQVQAIYHHVRRRCHPLNHMGAWTTAEDETLLRLVAENGLAWEAISGEMGRMGTNCRDRWRYIQSQVQSGGRSGAATEASAAVDDAITLASPALSTTFYQAAVGGRCHCRPASGHCEAQSSHSTPAALERLWASDSMSSAPTSDRTVASGTIYKDSQTLKIGEDPEAVSTAWWLSSDGEHAHTACPLRPFAHMVVALGDGGGDGGWADNPGRRGSSSIGSSSGCSALGRISTQQLMASRVVHLSDTLRRKMHSIAPGSAVDGTVGDMLRFAASSEDDEMRGGGGSSPNTRMRAVSSGLWSMLGWLVGSNISSAAPEPHARRAESEPAVERPYRRREVAEERGDDPLLVGNEGLGAVELAVVRAGRQASCVFALCAHALAPAIRDEWRAWQAAASSQRTQSTVGDESLAVVHVAEVSTLHRVACAGMPSVVPPALALEQHFAPLVSGTGTLGAAPQLPALVRDVDEDDCGVDAAVRNMALLVSRHGLVEMAYPLRPTQIVSDSDDDGESAGLTVALGGLLGESLFSRIHPEDVARVVKALRLAWDARPDAYHFARLRREWQRKRQEPSSMQATKVVDSRQILHSDGIEVANGVVGLTLQLQVTGAQAAAVDWSCAESTAHHTRFARMQLTRWPLVVRPPRSTGTSEPGAEPHDGFVLAAIQPLAEPARARARTPLAADGKKRSISSVASSSTLVGLGSSSSLLGSAELVRLCRSASNLSFDDATARPSLDIPPVRGASAMAMAMAIPGSLSKRRNSIAPASLHESAAADHANAFATPRELAY